MSEIIINNDGPLDIALGNDRNTKTWRNKQMLWSELVAKFSVTKVTYETHAEYMVMKRDKQDEIKDVGGFVGGYCTNGRRKANTIAHRQLITLDIDRAPSTFWEDYTMLYGEAAALYTTHKHSPASPRYRLVIPLNREVTSDEYEPIARRIAGRLSIDDFDDTTYDVNRLMYWPSTSKDGVFDFQYQDGDWLDADYILNTYVDWRDASAWPVSSRQSARVLKDIKKQGDPLEKPGLIGAFCRTYTIPEVIEKYLQDVYEACDIENRYTYKEGSTAGGLIVYDDKYAYSHHGTDPTSHKLCNAFDLVRLHKYGLKDEGVDREKTPVNRLPSFVAMSDFAAADAEVKFLIGTERLADAKDDFEGLGEETEEVNQDWLKDLDADRKGNIQSTIHNGVVILSNDPYFKGKLAFDDFDKCEVAKVKLPWRNIDRYSRRLKKSDLSNIKLYFEHTYGISSGPKIEDALAVVYARNTYHPVRDYLNGLRWDGTERLETLFIDYLGAEDNAYVRTVARKCLVAAITRIMHPGTKYDKTVVFVSEEGLGKSHLIEKLGKEWHSASFNFSLIKDDKKAAERIQGFWIIEVPEMSGLDGVSSEDVKNFQTRTVDDYRVAYERQTEKFPRQCIFFGTSNDFTFLKGPDKHRRYWPMPVGKTKPVKSSFVDLTPEEVDQVWAEALEYYKAGEDIYINESNHPKAYALEKEILLEHKEEHPWTAIIRDYLDTKLPANWEKMGKEDRKSWFVNGDISTVFNDDFEGMDNEASRFRVDGIKNRDRVCVHEIWAEALNRIGIPNKNEAREIATVMRAIADWVGEAKLLRYGPYGRQRHGYLRKVRFAVDVTGELTGVTNEFY